ncbi:gag/pol protein [Cucumis melo var. makuwa]|uniref:Gag/pol protein n=1 Tax=Cucumis melo var. makuwa TaxID=1194695 RepID=A0A5A7VIS3_CUCMM|nr:gag/pol protein [Cucumis melo var. makuwa]TYK26284.1 gag/pol protein [Cucumis melo var. makuwa]
MNLEMEFMYFNSVWQLVDLPEEVKPIGCKWIYKRKRDSAGKLQTFKARLVAKGYTQRKGVDYEETFSPVAMLKSIRILLFIATFYDYEILQMDVKTSFLNGNLEESIFMSQPEGFITQGQEQKVFKLNRSIYGLKQASRSWNIRFDTAIKSYGFDQNVDEPCVYKKINKGKVAFLVLYVDNILLIKNDVGYLTGRETTLPLVLELRKSANLSDGFFSLAMRPSFDVRCYNGCIVGGLRFYTVELDSRHDPKNGNNWKVVLVVQNKRIWDVSEVEDVENDHINVLEIFVSHQVDDHIEDDTLCRTGVDPTIDDVDEHLSYASDDEL